MIKKAVIPAAGTGTRFLPLTKAQPKEMLPIVDTPTIQYVIEEAINAGINDILIITGRGKRAIEDHFDRSFELEHQLREKGDQKSLERIQKIANMANIHYIRQKEQNGLGDAVAYAEQHVFQEPFAVLLGDSVISSPTPCIGQLMHQFYRFGASILAAEEVPLDKVDRYGILKGKQIEPNLLLLEELIEKPKRDEAPSNLAVAGRYIFTPDIFDFIRKTPKGKNGEIQLTDAIRLMIQEHAFFAYRFEGKRYDIGNKLDYLKTNIKFALERKEFRSEILEYMQQIVKENTEPRADKK
jgi:UTP--glucose-1-phosphate uridylyltransferase